MVGLPVKGWTPFAMNVVARRRHQRSSPVMANGVAGERQADAAARVVETGGARSAGEAVRAQVTATEVTFAFGTSPAPVPALTLQLSCGVPTSAS